VGPDLARRSIERMRLGVVVLDRSGEVVLANPAAEGLGLGAGGRVASGLARLAWRARQAGEPYDGEPYAGEIELARDRGRSPVAVGVEAHPVGSGGDVALFLTDLTEARRVDAVRRDFVANVSHELKTPVGALALLAEAVLDGLETDPAAVRRFAERMRHESSRLARLVQDLIDLSRLQGGEAVGNARAVAVDDVVAEAVDRSRLAAEARRIAVVVGGETGLAVRGLESQLVTAVANLVDNAVAYSPEDTTVALGVRARDGQVEITVTDQGIGIPEADQERVFERFYRSDPARSRATGGTGLGLAIVKHVVSNHGGSVAVWSVEGAGSTFTLRLPAASGSQAVRPLLQKGSA